MNPRDQVEVAQPVPPREGSRPQISILLPSLRPDALRQRIREFAATNAHCDYEIIVVSPFPVAGSRVVHVPETTRRGCIAAVALALEHATGELIVYWSDDSSPTPDCLGAMARFVEAHPAPFIGSFRILNGSGKEVEQWQAYDRLYACWGCLSRETVQQLGGLFDPAFRNYWADPDLSMRAWAAGGQVQMCPEAFVKVNQIFDEVRQVNFSQDFDRDTKTFIDRWHDRFGGGRPRPKLWTEINCELKPEQALQRARLVPPATPRELPAQRRTMGCRAHVLVVQLEWPTWEQARSWGYPVNFALEEGLRANGMEPFILPAFYDVKSSSPLSWLSRAKELCRGRAFDQVWLQLVHCPYEPEFLEWIAGLAPVRVGFLAESLEYLPEEWAQNPSLRTRRDYVMKQVKALTHVVCVDESDVDYINAHGPAVAFWWPSMVPARSVFDEYRQAKSNQGVFFGSLYSTERQQWMRRPDLRAMIACPKSREYETSIPAEFDLLHQKVFSLLQKGHGADSGLLIEYVERLRALRRASFDAWMAGLKEWTAVVNLPTFCKCYASRVVESMAAGRPAIAWETVDRPRNRALFENGKEILLYRRDQPEHLAEQIQRLQKEPDLARFIALNAREKVLRYHTAEIRIRQVLDWIQAGRLPDFGCGYAPEGSQPRVAPELPTTAPVTFCAKELTKTPARTTAFILTVGDITFPYCKRALEQQTHPNFKVEVIANVRPFSAAAQEMFKRCDTEYLIQVDEDMILDPEAVLKMESLMEVAPDEVGMICFLLHDDDRETNIQGIKIYRTSQMRSLRFQNVKASEMDLLEQMHCQGIRWIAHPTVVGRHGTLYTPEGIYLRYKSMYEKDIRTWNTVTWDIQKKAAKFRATGDPMQLFALLGAAHGIIAAPEAPDTEKDYARYNLRAIEVLKRLLLATPPYSSPYDAQVRAKPFLAEPLPLERVNWKPSPVMSRATGGSITPELTSKPVHSKLAGEPRLKILHTVEFYAPHVGGAEAVVQQVSERLVRRGHRVTVATSAMAERSFKELNGVEVVGFGVQGKLATTITGSVAGYQEFLRRSPAQVMMNYAAQQWATDLAFAVVSEDPAKRVNIIAPCGYSALVDASSLRWPEFQPYFAQELPRVLPLYDAAIYHSGIYKDVQFGAKLGLKNGVIIPNGTAEEEFSSAPQIDFRRKYRITTRYLGLCVANFYSGKGQEHVLDCVRAMGRPDFTLVLIGKEGDQLARLQALASGLNVRFLVDVPRADTLAAFHAADLFLFGSQTEASPLVILEAKASRTPFVSTDCGNVREWKGGLVCDASEMAVNANRLLDDSSERKRLAEEGWREWKEKLTWEAVVDRYEELYLKLHHAKGDRHRTLLTPAPSPEPMVCSGPEYVLSRSLMAGANDVVAADCTIAAQANVEAMANYSRQHPNDGFGRLWLGLAQWQAGQYQPAWESFEEAARLGVPPWRTAWYQALIIRDDRSRWGWQNYELARKLVAQVQAAQPGFASAAIYRLYLHGYYSQWGQDVLAEDFFRWNPVPEGQFVDVGAYDGISLSNTRHLFELGWAGICIEPVQSSYQLCARLYEGSKVRCVRRAISLQGGTVTITTAGTASSVRIETPAGPSEQVPASRLEQVLQELRVPRVDFLSIDAEGLDFEVLQSLNFQLYRPALIVIEYNTNPVEKARISKFLAAHNYTLWHDNVQDLFFRTNESIAAPNFWSQKTLLPKRPEPDATAAAPGLSLGLAVAGSVQTPTPKPEAVDRNSVCGLIFSKDRPLQLEGTLRSLLRHCRDAERLRLSVLYTTSDPVLEPFYEQIAKALPTVTFLRERSFKTDVLQVLGGSRYVLFLVDDNLFVHDFSLAEVTTLLEKHPDALGFSLRLGRNTTYCYPLDSAQALPEFKPVTGSTVKYNWTKAERDFGYPLEVSSSVYRTDDLLPLLEQLAYQNPNTLEGELAQTISRFKEHRNSLLCFNESVTFCAPLNRVQQVCRNRAGSSQTCSPAALAKLFAAGYRIDVAAYDGFRPNACHQEVELRCTPAVSGETDSQISGPQNGFGGPCVQLPASCRPGTTSKLGERTGSVPVSIIIPCYKQAHFLAEAVGSVLAQTYEDWELIIVNDGSPDNTSEVARRLIAQHADRRILLLEKPNGGLASARNTGVRAARGRYLLPLDADDQLLPTFLEKTVALLDQCPEIAVAYTDLQCFEGSQELIPKGEFGLNLMRENRVAYCALFRRQVWETVGGYNPNMSLGYEDWDFWVGAVEHGFQGRRVPEALFRYRVRAESMVSQSMRRHQHLFSRIVLNHPQCYDDGSRRRAEELLRTNPLPERAEQQPKISVVIPCYKQAHYLPEAVQSVAAQTYNDWEIIIVNDGSPDSTSAVARQLMQDCPGRITLLEKPNGGLSSARNAGIRAAQGEYVFLLDADDQIKPTMLEKTKAVLEANPKIGFAYTHIQHFGTLNTVFPLPDFDRATLLYKDNIVCGNCLVRKSAWQQAGGYDETMREGYEDWDFWVGCVEKGWIGQCLHEPLFLYRKTGQSMLTDANQKRQRLIARIVLNHPGLYEEKTRTWAKAVLDKSASQATPASVAGSASAPVAPASRPQPATSLSLAPLRITYLISSILGVTGGNQTLLRQAEEMRRRGHSVTIVTYTPKPEWFRFEVSVVQVPAGQPMAAHVPPSDVVVATYFTNVPELRAIEAPVKVYYAQGDQFVFGDATMADTEQNRLFQELSRASYQMPGIRCVPNSANLARAVERLCGRKADAILPVCTDQTIFRPLQKSLPGSRLRLLIVGPDSRGTAAEPLGFKGIEDVRVALEILARRSPHFTAVRMSSTPPEIFARFPCEFYIAPSDEMKTTLFGTAHILIYASHYDSCPRPPQEAMAAGCAVVCTATSGALEYCRDGENALLVPVKSPEAIAQAVERLIQDEALRQKLIEGGLATAREYPREREWEEWEALLRRFMGEVEPRGSKSSDAADKLSKPTEPVRATATKAITLPPCALVGHLGPARGLLRQTRSRAAWQQTLEAIKARPFHPEAYLLLAEIAQTAGDSASARRCAEHARRLAPGWKPARKFLNGKLRGNAKCEWFVLPDGLKTGDTGQKTEDGEQRNRLSVCLIVRNEEKFLGQCLQSVRGLADQIVVVDTGSTDRTVEIAKQHGAEVHHFQWRDDFSAARNAALEHATGDWILVLDADEEVPSESHAGLRQLMTEPAVIAWRLPLIDVGREDEGCSYVPRLFRNAPGLFYVGRVHEQIFSSLEVRREEWGLEHRLGDAALRHYGYDPQVVKDRNKVERNLRLLEQAVSEMPEEPHLRMNYGLELIRSGQLDTGLDQYRCAFELMSSQPASLQVPETREMMLVQFSSHLMKRSLFQEIIQVLQSPLAKTAGLNASLHFTLGLAHLELKQFREAADHMRQCLALRHKPSLAPINKEIRLAGPRHCLALCLEHLGETEAAAKEFAAAVAENPKSIPARCDQARFLAAQGQPIEALNLLFALGTEVPTDARVWLLGGQIALSQPDFLEVAVDWTAEASSKHSKHLGILQQRAEALTLSGQCEAALPLWRQAQGAAKPAALAALVLCETLVGENEFSPPASLERAISREFIKWYQRLLRFKAGTLVEKLSERIETLQAVLPSAAGLIAAATAEARAETLVEA